jgi:hypothetical protein
MTLVTDLSLYAVYIRLLFGETFLSRASAFLWRFNGRAFLVSNWHNFSGRKPIVGAKDDLSPRSDTGGIPDTVECVFYRDRLSGGQPVGAGQIFYPDRFPLTDDAGQPLYKEHPFAPRVDIAALPIELHSHVIPYFLNEYPFDENVDLYASQDVFIVGFPFGPITGTPLPIWKRGSIASEPRMPIDGLNKVFVDTAGRRGMSGSFVIAQHNGLFHPQGKPSFIGVAKRLFGIYSGRVHPSATEAQLGIVWHREEIDKTVQRGKTHPQS